MADLHSDTVLRNSLRYTLVSEEAANTKHRSGWFARSGPRRARPLLGRLPLLHLLPQDAHSLLDYTGAAVGLVTAAVADSPAVKTGAFVVGSGTALVSAASDYRLSVAKVVPIEGHAAFDYLAGLTHIALSVFLRRGGRKRLIAGLELSTGLLLVGAALLTDYRAQRGIGQRKPTSAH